MALVRFDGRPGDRLIVFGYQLAGGEKVELTDEQAAQLVADPYVDVTVLDGHEPEAGNGEGHDQPDADDGEGHTTKEE